MALPTTKSENASAELVRIPEGKPDNATHVIYSTRTNGSFSTPLACAPAYMFTLRNKERRYLCVGKREVHPQFYVEDDKILAELKRHPAALKGELKIETV